jgi:hypothetical protein
MKTLILAMEHMSTNSWIMFLTYLSYINNINSHCNSSSATQLDHLVLVTFYNTPLPLKSSVFHMYIAFMFIWLSKLTVIAFQTALASCILSQKHTVFFVREISFNIIQTNWWFQIINLYRPNVPYMERSLYVPIYGRYLCVALRMH